jgi:hypothetical protein
VAQPDEVSNPNGATMMTTITETMTEAEIENFFDITGIRKTSNRGRSFLWLAKRPLNTFYYISSISNDLGDRDEDQILQAIRKMDNSGGIDLGEWKNVPERVILEGTLRVKLIRKAQ